MGHLGYISLAASRACALAAIITANPAGMVSGGVLGACEGTAAYATNYLGRRALALVGLQEHPLAKVALKVAIVVAAMGLGMLFCTQILGLAMSFKAVLMLNAVAVALKGLSEGVEKALDRLLERFKVPQKHATRRWIKELVAILAVASAIFAIYHTFFGVAWSLPRVLALVGAVGLFSIWENHIQWFRGPVVSTPINRFVAPSAAVGVPGASSSTFAQTRSAAGRK